MARVIIGLILLVSGFLKLEDPVGTMLIVSEYLRFFHLSFLLPLAKAIGICFGFLEGFTGAALLCRVFQKTAINVCRWLLGFFTAVTLVLWLFNPSWDCGCFGEAIHLTHFQSLLKNIILLGLSFFLSVRAPGREKWWKWAVMAGSLAFVCIFSSLHLPPADFTPYHLGADLDENGAVLSFSDSHGEYHDSLALEGHVVVFSVYDPDNVNWGRLRLSYSAVAETGATPILLMASYPEEGIEVPPEIEPYYCDYRSLVGLNRSNGGGCYTYDGEIVDKWAAKDFPEDIFSEMTADPTDLGTKRVQKRRTLTQGFSLAVLAVLILF